MNRLKELRNRAGLTMVQVAEKLGVAKITIVRWEAGEMNPRLSRAKELAEAYGVSLDELFGEKVS